MSVRRETFLIPFLLVAVMALAWAFVVWAIANMNAPLVRLMMPSTAAWSPLELFWVWVMWAVMMGAMMLPSAMPMILTYRRVVSGRGHPVDTFYFALAYLLVWIGFSVVAALLQGGLQAIGVLSPMLILKANWISGGLLVLAGLFQWTPLKQRCLAVCRTPVGFLTTEWRPGAKGALLMGLRHGAYCLGCCWAVMALLFVFGVMNLVAIIGIATLVAVEKLLPHGDNLSKIGGVLLVGWGLLLIAA